MAKAGKSRSAAKNAKGKQTRRRQKDVRLRRSVMGTMSILLMLTALIVALIPVPKTKAVLGNDDYTAWNDAKYYINDATCPTANWFSPYTINGMKVFADGTGALRVSYDASNGGVVVAYNEESPQPSLDIPENMPAYRFNETVDGYVAADEQGRFLYYYDTNGSGSFRPCLYNEGWDDGRILYALTNSEGLATEVLTSYTVTSLDDDSQNTNLPARTPSTQLSVPIRYIGMPDVAYRITLANDGSSNLNVDHPDGYWETLTDVNYEGVFEGKALQSVTIPSSIVAVGDQAFQDCRNLSSVSFANGLTAIGNRAFKGCVSLSGLALTGGDSTLSYLKYIGDEAFSGCTNLGNFELPTSVTTLGNFCFSNCKALTAPNLGGNGTSNLQTIGNGLFYGCDSLKQVSLPASVRLSGYSNVNLPTAGDNAVHLLFYGCSSLEDLVLPEFGKSAQEFRYDNVTGCYNLHLVKCENFQLSFDCPSSSKPTPCDYIEDPTETFSKANLGKGYFDESAYELPEDFCIESSCSTSDPVYQYALRHKRAFHSLTTSDMNFYDTYCILSDGYIYYAKMTSNPNAEIFRCQPLDSADPSANVIIPGNIGPCQITEIAAGAFSSPAAMEYLYIPEKITSIADNAFSGCSELRNVYFENANGCAIGRGAFKTDGSNAVYQDGGLRFFGDVDPNPNTTPGEYPKTPYSYAMTAGNNYNGSGAPTDDINYCSEFPWNLEVERAEDGAATLVSVPNYDRLEKTYNEYLTIQPYVEQMEAAKAAGDTTTYNAAFDSFKTQLKSIMTTSGTDMYPLSRYYSSFQGENEDYEHSFFNEMRIAASAYKRYFLDGDDMQILKEEERNVIEAVLHPEISEGIEYLKEDLFKGNDKMESIVMHSIRNIPANEFEDCSALETVQMYPSVQGSESIGENAFKNCDNLVSVVLPSSTGTIGDLPFIDSEKLTSVSFTDGSSTGEDGNKFSCRQGLLMETRADGSPYEIIECLQARGDVINGFGNSAIEASEVDGLSSIRKNAFEKCRDITEADLSTTNITNIPDRCFLDANSLFQVSLPESCNYLGTECFKNTAIGVVQVRNTQMDLNPRSAFTDDNGREYDGVKYLNNVMLEGYPNSTAQMVGDNPNYPTIHFRSMDDRKWTVTYICDGEEIYKEQVAHGGTASFTYVVNYLIPKDTTQKFKEWRLSPEGATLNNVTMDIVATAELEANDISDNYHKVTIKSDDYGQPAGKFTPYSFVIPKEDGTALTQAELDTHKVMKRTGYIYDLSPDIVSSAMPITGDMEIIVQYSKDPDYKEPEEETTPSPTPAVEKEKHVVTFLVDGEVFASQYVEHGDYPKEVTTVPKKKGYTFLYWTPTNYTSIAVLEDTTIVAQFEKGSDKSTSGSGTSGSGNTTGTGGSVSGKSGKSSSGSSDSSSTTNSKKMHTVSFVDYNGQVLSTQQIENGKTAGSFAYVPVRTGYKFVSWSPSNYASIPITMDLIVRATYQKDPNYKAPATKTVSGNATGKVKPKDSNTKVDLTKTGFSNKGLAAASVGGSNDNFIVKITDSDEARNKMEQAFLNAYGSLDNLKYFAMDISLYDSTGTTKIINTNGLSVNVTLPIPDAMAGYAGNNKIATVDSSGKLEKVNARLITIDNVPCMSFTAPHFSPYAIYVETNNLTQGAIADVSPKTGDPIHPKWFLAIGLALASILMFALRPSRKIVKVIA
ncbi:MAG: leucine-rich repeat domain-containing protein [Lachnospiraceae bacterium]|nr:leucine-rich repeat domain-containing protein [Lachnospiraceae bacterium]